MSILNGDNYTIMETSGSPKLDMGEFNGAVKHIHESYTILAALESGDTILGPILPAGARVIDATLKVDATLGSAGIIELGHLVSDDATIAADADAFADADAGGQAVLGKPTLANPGILQKFAVPVQTLITCTETSTETSGVTISYSISFVVD